MKTYLLLSLAIALFWYSIARLCLLPVWLDICLAVAALLVSWFCFSLCWAAGRNENGQQ